MSVIPSISNARKGGGVMFHPRAAILLTIFILASAVPANAHLGNENNTEIRVFADSMRIILRTSIPFAWSLLGADAPPMADEAGQAVAKPLLIAAAPGLITVTAGGNPLTPAQTDCMFEVQDDVAFIYNFKRPVDWPVVVKIEFFTRLGNLETGTIAAYDYSASRFARDVEPLARKTIDRDSPSLSFTLVPPPVAATPQPQPTPTPRPPGGSWKIAGILFLLTGVATVAGLVFRRMNGR
jgi:hypothetical protein